MRQTADPDHSTNKLVCPMSFSTDLWIRTENDCSTSHYCPMKFELEPDHDWLVYNTWQTGIDEWSNMPIQKYIIYGLLLKLTLTWLMKKKFKILFVCFFSSVDLFTDMAREPRFPNRPWNIMLFVWEGYFWILLKKGRGLSPQSPPSSSLLHVPGESTVRLRIAYKWNIHCMRVFKSHSWPHPCLYWMF